MSYNQMKFALLAALASLTVMAVTPSRAVGINYDGATTYAAAEGPPPAAPAPKKMSMDDIVGAIIVFINGSDNPIIVFTFNDGTIAETDGDTCLKSMACTVKLKALMDSKHVLPIEPDDKQPDIKT